MRQNHVAFNLMGSNWPFANGSICLLGYQAYMLQIIGTIVTFTPSRVMHALLQFAGSLCSNESSEFGDLFHLLNRKLMKLAACCYIEAFDKSLLVRLLLLGPFIWKAGYRVLRSAVVKNDS